MVAEKNWFAAVQHKLKKSHLMTNFFLSLALAGLEKITEAEFACLCNPKYNAWFSAAFFVVPSVMVFVLMMITWEWKKCTEWKSDCKPLCKNIAISAVPALVWIILVFLDGQYYACAKTSWSGRYVIIDRAGPKKWCEPYNPNLTEEYMIQTQHWFSVSQGIGIIFAVVLTVLTGMYVIFLCCYPPTDKLIKTKINNDQKYVKITRPGLNEYLDSAFKRFQPDYNVVKVFDESGTEVDADVFEEVAQRSNAGVFTIRLPPPPTIDNGSQETPPPSSSSGTTSSESPQLDVANNSPSAPNVVHTVE